MKQVVLFLIRIYQQTLSYDHGLMGKVFPSTRNCKFTPSCSEYGYEAIDKYGVIKGGNLAVKRILRCTPRALPGQYDPVP